MSKKHKSEINERFVAYFRENFFENKPEELEQFLTSLTKPLPKTIRVNTNRISVEDFKARAERNQWTLTPSNNPTVFRIDRPDTKTPLGHTLEHLLGYFYIQELSASMSVHYLTADTSPSYPHPLTLTSPFSPHPSPLLEGEGVNDEY